jgi:hypothetical protein
MSLGINQSKHDGSGRKGDSLIRVVRCDFEVGERKETLTPT